MNLKDHAKSATKAVTWRLVGAVDTFVLAFVITGNLHAAGGIVGFEVITKSVLYYFHERLWTLPVFGKFFGGTAA